MEDNKIQPTFRFNSDSASLKIVSLRDQNPCLTLSEIGNLIGVSRQAVWTVLNRARMPTARYRTMGECKVCGAPTKKVYCSPSCKYRNTHIEVACPECGDLKTMRVSVFMARTKRNKRIFCSHKCQGAWSSKNWTAYIS